MQISGPVFLDPSDDQETQQNETDRHGDLYPAALLVLPLFYCSFLFITRPQIITFLHPEPPGKYLPPLRISAGS